ncbi:MAG: acyl-[ACP]--phospholipid O-acyltransferase [Alphaproteobacteria bacterium]|jgi:acyl-[acyl-carrier-protein]-phospholipid O-acyltransferase/long-chain-fatty-acid--[acyl-carrier-protein] ligase
MTETAPNLLKTRRFLPLFVTQFLGAMNDNLMKQALIMMITFGLLQSSDISPQILVTMAAGIFILPFFLFSATAGQIADKFEKSASIQRIKIVEIFIMAIAVAGFYLSNTYFLIAVLFMMGTQSAFFGPLKYGILPSHLKENELIGGNALIEGGTFLAILIGTIAGGLLIVADQGISIVSASLLIVALLGWVASRAIPKADAADPDLKINTNIFQETWRMVARARETRSVFLSIMGISWFWLTGATFLSQFPNFSKILLGGDASVVTLLMVTFSLGIGIGSYWCTRLLKGEVSAKYVPLSALALTGFTLDLYFASRGLHAPTSGLMTATDFINSPANWRILFDLTAIAVCGGLYTVPLYAILQNDSDPTTRSRTIAANNILNALFMVVGAIIATLMLAADWSIPQVFLSLAIANGFVALYITRLLPFQLIKLTLATILKAIYRVDVKGLEHYSKAGKRAVIVVNHVSLLDPLLLSAFLPVKPMFAVNTHISQQWWVKPFLTLVDAFPVDPTNSMSMKGLIKAVKEDRHCVVFPEGRITVTGALMKIYEGPGMVADKSDAMLIPVRIDGAQYTPFSRLRGKIRLRLFPKITITLLPPRKFELPEDLSGRERRQITSERLYDVMSDLIFETCDYRRSLFEGLLEARRVHGGKHLIVEDTDRNPLSYNQLLLSSLVLGRCIARDTPKDSPVGVLLPNSLGGAVTFFALQAYGRTPAMLDFSIGIKNMLSALETAQIKTVLTSRKFIKLAELDDVATALSKKAKLVYLEDVRERSSLGDKISGLIQRQFPGLRVAANKTAATDPAVVLFTSGSEGTPKCVVLSHENVMANRYQLAAKVDFNPRDIVFNALPMFHSFGLTGGTLLPILSGLKTFLYPSPLHYRIIPALVYDTDATILFSTDTFLGGYGKAAHPYDFYSLRYVFAGAETVRDDTRAQWADKFGLRIMEGYGATETAPVLAVNTPMHYKAGTVGRLLPNIRHSIEPVPGIEQGGKLLVSGPNIMLGYFKADNPGVLEPPEDRIYDTGDIVDIDQHGYVTILGRAKRFAKIAGEMVSLTVVEGYATAIWPGQMHAAVSIPDDKKGERVILLTDMKSADRAQILDYAKTEGVAEIMIPRTVQIVDELPLLGTGKLDYPSIQEMVAG